MRRIVVRVDAARRRDGLGRERRCASRRDVVEPVDVVGRRRRGRRGPRRTSTCTSAKRKSASVAGRIGRCSSASSAVFVRRGSTTTSLPPRARSARSRPGHVGRGHQRPVRRERVRAEHQEVVGAVDVGDRDRERAAEHQAGRHLLRHLVDRARGVDVRRARAPAAAPGCRRGPRGCARSGCRGRPRARRGRAARGSALSPASIAANASSHVTSWNVSPPADQRPADAVGIGFELLERGALRAEVAVAEHVVAVAAHERDLAVRRGAARARTSPRRDGRSGTRCSASPKPTSTGTRWTAAARTRRSPTPSRCLHPCSDRATTRAGRNPSR